MDAVPPDGSDPVVDWWDAVSHASPPPELTTVGSRSAVVHEGSLIRRYQGLEPSTVYELDGFAFETLPEALYPLGSATQAFGAARASGLAAPGTTE